MTPAEYVISLQRLVIAVRLQLRNAEALGFRTDCLREAVRSLEGAFRCASTTSEERKPYEAPAVVREAPLEEYEELMAVAKIMERAERMAT